MSGAWGRSAAAGAGGSAGAYTQCSASWLLTDTKSLSKGSGLQQAASMVARRATGMQRALGDGQGRRRSARPFLGSWLPAAALSPPACAEVRPQAIHPAWFSYLRALTRTQ